MHFRRFFPQLAFLTFLFLGASSVPAHAGWTLVAQLRERVGCGFFFDTEHGFVGTGRRQSFGQPALIYETTDGGTTWVQMNVPANVFGAVTGIHMRTSLIGYASIFSETEALWSTVDGGKNWQNVPIADAGNGTDVFSTPTATVFTAWSLQGSSAGSISFNGTNFNYIFHDRQLSESNAVDFADNQHGVVLMGPHGFNQGASCFYTSDGGLNWSKSYTTPEAWGVYALKGTTTFFAAPEGASGGGQSSIYRSTDDGATWQTIYTFNTFVAFTGHIAGAGTRLYAQSDIQVDNTMYRSDDLGLSWHAVNGPGNDRDTRFAIPPTCDGLTVYAFDQVGGIWKTTDGGDGTVSVSGKPLTLSQDTLRFRARYCEPDSQQVVLGNQSCSATSLDSIHIGNGVRFSTTGFQQNSLAVFAGDTVGVTYHPSQGLGDSSIITLFGHQGTTVIAKTIVLQGHNFTAPTPMLGQLKPVKAADTILIPIFLQPTLDTFRFSSASFSLRFNGDVLTPIDIEQNGTLTQGGTAKVLSIFGNTVVSCSATGSTTLSQHSDLTKPLVYLRARVTLSDSLSTDISLEQFALDQATPLTLCSIPSARFTAQTICGDSTIVEEMNHALTTMWLSANPNPAHSGNITVQYSAPAVPGTRLELHDAIGNRLSIPGFDQLSGGEHELELPLPATSGSYILSIRVPGVGVRSLKLSVLR